MPRGSSTSQGGKSVCSGIDSFLPWTAISWKLTKIDSVERQYPFLLFETYFSECPLEKAASSCLPSKYPTVCSGLIKLSLVQDLPVTYQDKHMFIDSASGILKEKSPIISCNQPAVVKIGKKYYSQVINYSILNAKVAFFYLISLNLPPLDAEIRPPCSSIENW